MRHSPALAVIASGARVERPTATAAVRARVFMGFMATAPKPGPSTHAGSTDARALSSVHGVQKTPSNQCGMNVHSDTAQHGANHPLSHGLMGCQTFALRQFAPHARPIWTARSNCF